MSLDIPKIVNDLTHLSPVQMMFFVAITSLILVGVSLYVLLQALKKEGPK